MARRAGMAIVGMGLAWTVLAGGLGFGLWGLASLLSQVMPTAAAVLATGAAAVVGASLILFGRRRRAGPHAPAAEQLPKQLIERYPLESVVVAAAAGFFVAQSEDIRAMLVRELLRVAPQKGA
ncbi:MAG TPA: hypothetical protein VKE22_24750 [Haliangiales bacterium]|nr:hypothetical protein [Haliangiales bacterium]